MKRWLFAALIILPTIVLGQSYDGYNDYSAPSYGNSAPYNSQSGGWNQPRPAYGPNDRATLGDSQPRTYGKPQSLGDSRTYRETNPNTCTSLMCN